MAMIRLPSELLRAILLNLDFRDLLRCREVSTRLKTLIDEDIRAQYKLELAIAGMEDGPLSTRTTAERLSILHSRQNAWSQFAWSSTENIPMHEGDVWELCGNILVQSEGNRLLHFRQIPSAIRGIQSTEWVIPDVGCDMTDIGMDPAQDLLVIVEYLEDDSQLTCHINLHLRSLSTGAPHPAGPPILTYELEPDNYSYSVQTSEDYLGVLLSSQVYGNPTELLIWDWKNGMLHLHLDDYELHSWAFLTSHSILVAYGGRAFDAPRLVVIDLESTRSPKPVQVSDVDYTCAFHYPPLADTVDVLDMVIRSDPGANWCPSPALGVPFSVSCEERIFVVTLWLSNYSEERAVLSFVSVSTLRRALATLAPGETRHQFQWKEWGPHGSRLMEAPDTYTTMEVHFVYGTVFATVGTLVDAEGRRVRKFVIVRDFNQLAIRHRAAAGARYEEQGDVQVVAEETTFEPQGVFKEEVVTALPYTERIFEPFESMPALDNVAFDTVMLAEDALVLVGGAWRHPLQYFILSI